MASRNPKLAGAALSSWVLVACQADPVDAVGQFGAPIPLATGDESLLPRLFFIDEGCPGAEAAGGCPADDPDRSCRPILIDSLAPLTALRRPDTVDVPTFTRECIEVRAAEGMAATDPSQQAREDAVTRFRFRDVPLVRASADGTDDWSWRAGDQDSRVDPDGVLGGNVLSELAVAFRSPRQGRPTVAFYGEFPGTERDLADQGRAFLPLQFPGRLLGRDLNDRCDIDGGRCDLRGFDLQGRVPVALSATRMVMDACVAVPPCAVRYEVSPEDPFSVGVCQMTPGPDAPPEETCVAADDPSEGGRSASLVVATGVSGLVLFSDSTQRMFGDPESLPSCDAVEPGTAACLVDRAGALFLSGWPSAGDVESGQTPLYRLRVRSVSLVPGLTRSRGSGPCARTQARLDGLLDQCEAFVDAVSDLGSIEDTTPPYASDDPEASSDTSVAIFGETRLGPDQSSPDPARWIPTLVLPDSHPLVLSLRRDVAPAAIQPDGLLGSVLLDNTVTVLDYTDPNPGLRVSCLDPTQGECLVAANCAEDAQPACCFGLPLNLLVSFIVRGGDETCCGALSAEELAEIQALGQCQGVTPL